MGGGDETRGDRDGGVGGWKGGGVMKTRKAELLLLLLLYALVFVHGFIHLSPTWTGGRVPFARLVPVFALFSLLHAIFMLGWRRAAAFFAVSTVLSLTSELAGVRTGLIFGRYVYTDALGQKILGDVPWVIPLAWFMMIYPAYVIASLALDGQPIAKGGRLGRLCFFALVGGMIMTAWDLTLDPYMVGIRDAAWIWKDAGPYFGVPFHNYAGWVLTTFLVFLVYVAWERRLPLRPLGRLQRHVIALPLVTYAFMSVGDVVIGYPEASRLISPFAMGIGLIAAVTRLAAWRPGASSAIP
jgi:putative membrane protein